MAAARGRALGVVGGWLHLKTPQFWNADEMIVSLLRASHERWLDRTHRDDLLLLGSSADTLENHSSTVLALSALRQACRDCKSLPPADTSDIFYVNMMASVLRDHQAQWHTPEELVVDFMELFYDNNTHRAFHICWRGEGTPAQRCSDLSVVGRCERVELCHSCYPVNVRIPCALMMVHRAVAELRYAIIAEDSGLIEQAYKGLVLLGVFFELGSPYARHRATVHLSPAKRRYAETLQSLAASVRLLGDRVAGDLEALKDLDMEAYLVFRGMLLTP